VANRYGPEAMEHTTGAGKRESRNRWVRQVRGTERAGGGPSLSLRATSLSIAASPILETNCARAKESSSVQPINLVKNPFKNSGPNSPMMGQFPNAMGDKQEYDDQ
jgi:hypothetical protein